ncbi:unnamed protein product, partial [Arabidopsis halleri]
MHYEKYDPFILPEQCDQVCYIPYPRLRRSDEEWWASTKVVPRGFRETTEIVDQIALQDDIHNHFVAPSGIIRVEAHALEDASDDEPIPMDNPNDDHHHGFSPSSPVHQLTLRVLHLTGVSTTMNLRGPSSSRGTNMHFRASQGVPMPPGATRSTNSAAARHPLPSLAAVMSAPERRNMPHLHPQRLNGALWFDIHVCITKDIVATYQSDFWGPWWNFGMVPLSKKDSWWTSFVQKYYWSSEHHDQVLHCWEDTLKDSIRNLVSKRKRNGKKPDYIGLSDWNRMLDIWETERAKERSQTNSKNRKSDPEGLGTHRHVSGAKKHTRVAYEMSIEAGGVAPPATEVVRRTHTRK